MAEKILDTDLATLAGYTLLMGKLEQSVLFCWEGLQHLILRHFAVSKCNSLQKEKNDHIYNFTSISRPRTLGRSAFFVLKKVKASY